MATGTMTAAAISDTTTFRVYAQFVHDAFVNGGWTVTGDTGQTVPSSQTYPGAGNTSAGYEVFAMADSLQATYPIYCRVDYYRANNAGAFGLKFTIGKSTNGAGTITNVLYTTTSPGTSSTPSVANGVSFYSSGTNRVAINLCGQVSTALGTPISATCTYGIERSCDNSGVPTGDGVYVVWCQPNSTFNFQYTRYSDAVALDESSSSGSGSIVAPIKSTTTTNAASQLAVYPLLMMGQGEIKPPSRNFIGSYGLTYNTEYTVHLMGNTYNFKRLPLESSFMYKWCHGGNTSQTSINLLMRYD